MRLCITMFGINYDEGHVHSHSDSDIVNSIVTEF
jgi:hypothetical protein